MFEHFYFYLNDTYANDDVASNSQLHDIWLAYAHDNDNDTDIGIIIYKRQKQEAKNKKLFHTHTSPGVAPRSQEPFKIQDLKYQLLCSYVYCMYMEKYVLLLLLENS